MVPKKKSRKLVYSGELFNFYLDEVELGSGKIIKEYHLLEFIFDSVVVILLDDSGNICLIKSPRYTTGKIELELPAGSIEKGESIPEAAAREIREETGYTVRDLKLVYSFNPANGISGQKAHVLLGNINSEISPLQFNKDEVSSVEWFSIEHIREKLKKNLIMDGFSIIALLWYLNLQS